MALGAYFQTKGMTLDSYNEVHARLDAAGQGHNPHRLHHSCFGPEGDMMVFDIWDSEAEFQAFGAVLMPILADLGIDAGEPAIMPIHKLLQYDADQ
jgi:hypothetical protein